MKIVNSVSELSAAMALVVGRTSGAGVLERLWRTDLAHQAEIRRVEGLLAHANPAWQARHGETLVRLRVSQGLWQDELDAWLAFMKGTAALDRWAPLPEPVAQAPATEVCVMCGREANDPMGGDHLGQGGLCPRCEAAAAAAFEAGAH